MTPLLAQFCKQEIAGETAIPLLQESEMLRHLGGAACFEVSDVMSLAVEMAEEFVRSANVEDYGFLPAPVTWIEYRHDTPWSGGQLDDGRVARFRLRERRATVIKQLDVGRFEGYQILHQWTEGDIDREPQTEIVKTSYDVREFINNLSGLPKAHRHRENVIERYENRGRTKGLPVGRSVVEIDNDENRFTGTMFPLPSHLCVLLAFINTPKIIGTRQHSLNKKLVVAAKKAGIEGKYPLRAWTEIKLSAAVPDDVSDDVPNAATLTGTRAFHFCRAHLRVRLGRLEFVRAHTRGDKSKGIKRSRYKVQK